MQIYIKILKKIKTHNKRPDLFEKFDIKSITFNTLYDDDIVIFDGTIDNQNTIIIVNQDNNLLIKQYNEYLNDQNNSENLISKYKRKAGQQTIDIFNTKKDTWTDEISQAFRYNINKILDGIIQVEITKKTKKCNKNDIKISKQKQKELKNIINMMQTQRFNIS